MNRDTILVTGSRSWTNRDVIRGCLRAVMAHTNVKRMVHGAATGADSIADDIWLKLGGTVERYPVDVTIDGPWPRAGVFRNERMVRIEAPRVARVLAFTSLSEHGTLGITKGTADCISRCIRSNLVVTIVPEHRGEL